MALIAPRRDAPTPVHILRRSGISSSRLSKRDLGFVKNYIYVMCIMKSVKSDPEMLLRLSKKELSAIEAVLDIALNGGGALVQSSDITERLDIPPRYLEPILQRLGRAGLLVGMRGPAGGYRLARERRRISLGDLVDAIRAGDPESAEAGRLNIGSTRAGQALTDALDVLDRDIHERLQAITIEDLCWRTGTGASAPPRRAGADFAI